MILFHCVSPMRFPRGGRVVEKNEYMNGERMNLFCSGYSLIHSSRFGSSNISPFNKNYTGNSLLCQGI